jgi:hypothetical protein
MAAPNSAYVRAPARMSKPPTIHASKISEAEGTSLAIIPVVRKIPEPMTMPTIIMVESNNPSFLIKPSWEFFEESGLFILVDYPELFIKSADTFFKIPFKDDK